MENERHFLIVKTPWLLFSYNTRTQNLRTKAGVRIFVKSSPYLSNGLTDRHEI